MVALNSRKYFWNEIQPDEFAKDLEQVAEYYLKLWDKSSLTIVGSLVESEV